MRLKKINFRNIILSMFAYLRGLVTERNLKNSSLILEVNNIGYEIFSNHKTLNHFSRDAEQIIHVYTQSNEAGIKLWGFSSRAERELFECLISVSGVGPKAAQNMLNVLNIEEIISAVLREKHELLREAPGVGPKTAKRIVLELKSKLSNINVGELTNNEYDSAEDVSSILAGLGFSVIDIDKKLAEAHKQGVSDDAEELVRFCMKN